MTAPLVSIVIPTYNRAYCIERTVDSVLGQTHRNVEVVLVDDGSSDGTDALVAARYEDEPRLRYVKQANGGVCAARNHGLRIAKGDMVGLLDSDDVFLPWKIEAQVRCLEAYPSVGMVWTDMMAVDPDENVIAPRYLEKMYGSYDRFSREELFRERRPLREIAPELAAQIGDPILYVGDIYSPMVTGNLVHTSTVLLRRDRLEKVRAFDESLKQSGEDYDFHLRTCREGDVALLDASSIRYMWGRADQLTAPKYGLVMAQNFLKTVESALARDRARITLSDRTIDEVLAHAHRWIGEAHLDRGENALAREHLAKSLRHVPRQPRVAGQLALTFVPARFHEKLRDGYRAVKSRVT